MCCGSQRTIACLGMPRVPRIRGSHHTIYKDSPFQLPPSQPCLKHITTQVTQEAIMVFYNYRNVSMYTFLSMTNVFNFRGEIIPWKEITEVSTLNILTLISIFKKQLKVKRLLLQPYCTLVVGHKEPPQSKVFLSSGVRFLIQYSM